MSFKNIADLSSQFLSASTSSTQDGYFTNIHLWDPANAEYVNILCADFEINIDSDTTTPVTINLNGQFNCNAISTESIRLDNTGLRLLDTNASHVLIVSPGSNLTADRTLTVTTGDSNRTLTMSGDATISGTNTGDQSVFGTIAVSGQSDVVADSTTDTLTLVAGTNITITTNAGSDSITIATSGMTHPQVLARGLGA